MFKTYFGFAIADGMFANAGECMIARRPMEVSEVRAMAEAGELISCLNPRFKDTIKAMNQRFGIYVPIPEEAPLVSLGYGDSVVAMAVSGLPRLTDRCEYTEEEIASAIFRFSMYTVI